MEPLTLLALTSLAGTGMQVYGQYRTNSSNAAYQDEANRLSVDLANTAHQREVADLRAAGLNPILSAGGSGAQTPTLGAVQASNPYEGLGHSAASVGRELARYGNAAFKAGLEETEARTANLVSSRAVIESEAELKRAMADAIRSGRSVGEFARPVAESLGDWIGERLGTAKAAKDAAAAFKDMEQLIPYKGRYRTLQWLFNNDPDFLDRYLDKKYPDYK